MSAARFFVAMALLASVPACAKPPPPKPPVEEPKPEPPPKCESLAEGCAAKPDTRVDVGVTWSIAPPANWTYAKESDATIARIDGAALAVTVFDGRDKKTATKLRDDALAALVAKIGVKLAKKMTWPAKPARTVSVGEREIALFQIEGSTQDGKPGALLVFVARPLALETVVGVGFVVESDAKDSDRAILAGVESLRALKASGFDKTAEKGGDK